jgi:catechol-2,3-dioxygenase
VRVVVRIAPRHPGSDASNRDPIPASRRTNRRAPPLERTEPVHPRKLGHVVIGSPDALRTRATFEALGFKVSDEIKDLAVFLRCSTDHHNLLIQRAPVPFLHHTSWQVADVDEIGRGAKAMLDVDPTRHTWGLGRHFVGSNFFWYLRDPAGNFAEYYADMDVIVDDQLWQPGVFGDERALYAWGPPPPASFIVPDDLADLMAR